MVHYTFRPCCETEQTMTKQRGFTLPELAIVVVIIGLLLVGILRSQNLIDSARVKDVVAIIDDLRASTNLFKQRYKYLPGDWVFLADEIPNIAIAQAPGNGDGALDGAIDSLGNAASGSEVAMLPQQLFNAGLIGKINSADALRNLATTYGAVHVVSRATASGLVPTFSTGTQNTNIVNAIVFQNLPCEMARDVDSKIDNGDLSTGRAVGQCVNGVVSWFAVVL